MTKRNFYLPDKVYKALGRIARRKGISVSEVVRRALEEYLEREEARS